MAVDEKAPSEYVPIPFHLGPEIPEGASIVSVQAFASRVITGFTTTIAAGNDAVEEAATLVLVDDPGIGALLIINEGSSSSEETFKVSAVSGGGPYTVTLSHTTEFAHPVSGTTVRYEPGRSARMLLDDTPTAVGTDVTLWVQNGADTQIYRFTVLATLDDGQVVELERFLTVTEHAPVKTFTIQVDVTADIELGLEDPIALAGADIDSAVLWMSRVASVGAQVASTITPGDSAIVLSANPGVGALVTLNPGATKHEKLKVTSVTPSGQNFSCEVDPTPEYVHDPPEQLTYEPGVSLRLLASVTPTISTSKIIARKRKGAARQRYRLTTLATFDKSPAERRQGSVFVDVVET